MTPIGVTHHGVNMKFKVFLTTGVVNVEAETWYDGLQKAGKLGEVSDGLMNAIIRLGADDKPVLPSPVTKGWDTER